MRFKSDKTIVAIFLFMLATSLMFLGCGDDTQLITDGDTEPTDGDTEPVDGDIESDIDDSFEKFVVGTNGGIFTSEDGVIIDISIGAVDNDMVIGIKKVTDKDIGDVTALSNVYEFAPAELTFSKPIFVTIPYTRPEIVNKFEAPTLYWSNQEDDTVFEPMLESATKDEVVTAEITHFSFGFVGMKIDLPQILINKWISTENSLLATNDKEATFFWSLSNAGLLLIDTKGTFDDKEDDSIVMQHEYTLDNWPTETDIKQICSSTSGENNILWFATQNDLYLYSDNGTIADGSDDVLTLLENEEVFSSSRQIKQLNCAASNTVWLGTNKGLVRIEIDPEALAEEQFIYDDFQAQSSKDSADFKIDGDEDDELEIEEDAEIETVDGDEDDENTEEEIEPIDIATMPSQNIRLSTLSPNGDIWFTVFCLNDNNYHLYKMSPKGGMETGYSSLVEIPFTEVTLGEEILSHKFVPKALAADISGGLWISNEINSNGVPVYFDTTDDSFTMFQIPPSVNVVDILPTEEGQAVLVEGSDKSFRLADYSSKSVKQFEDFGVIISINKLSSLAYLTGKLFYASQLDFGILSYDPAAFDGTYTRDRYIAPTGTPFNDILSFFPSDSGAFIGGTNSVSQLSYDISVYPTQYEATSTVIENPADSKPFNIKSLSPLKDGMLVGGSTLGFLDNNMKFHLWDNNQTPKSVSYALADLDDNIWVSSMVIDIITLVNMRIYDYNNTATNSDDDSTYIVSNTALGMESATPTDSIVFYEGCKGFFANTLGLHHYDCNDTPENSVDDLLVEKIIDVPVTSIAKARDNSYWFMSLNGLTYIKFDTMPPSLNNEDSYGENVIFKYSGMSSTFAYDETSGYLYYFVKAGLVIHDTKGTPLDDSDDMVALFEMASTRNTIVKLDHQGSLWFSYGNDSGIYHAIFHEPEFKPLADVL